MSYLFARNNVGIGFCLLGLAVLLLNANPAQAAVNKYWDAGGTTDSLGEAANWDGDTLPALDDVNFDDTGSTNLTPDTAGSDYLWRYLKFPDTCTVEYNIGSVGDSIKVSKINANHNNTQTIDAEIICTSSVNLREAGTIIEMHTFGTDDASVEFQENDNDPDSVARIQHLKGGDILYYSPGLLELTGDSGPSGTVWDGKINIRGYTAYGDSSTDCVVRISHDYALGTTVGITDIEGGDNYYGRLEVTNNITVPENFDLRGRDGDMATAVHISNASGDNTLTGDFNLTGSGFSCRIASEGGTLDIVGDITNVRSDEDRNLFLQGASDGTVSGVISDGVEDAKDIALYKEGAGTWTLSGTNTYTSTTLVSAGALSVTGSITSDTTVESGATLMGTGSILAAVTVESGGLIEPGTSIGTLSVDDGEDGDVDLNGTLVIEYDVASDTIDLLDISGDLDLTGGTIDFNQLGTGTLDPGVYVFATYDGALTGTPTEADVPSGFTVNYAYGGNSIALVPEPSTLVLLALGLLGLMVYVRRRR